MVHGSYAKTDIDSAQGELASTDKLDGIEELDSTDSLSSAAAEFLLAKARYSLAAALGLTPPPLPERPQEILLEDASGCFVTLTKEGQLRGCIGCLQADNSLEDAVAHYAEQAGFHDPRFPPMTAAELDQVKIEISRLTPLQLMAVDSRSSLLSQLKPYVDGLMLEEGGRRATFLPQVWEQLPDREQFLRALLHKGGWPSVYWSSGMKCWCYQVQSCQES